MSAGQGTWGIRITPNPNGQIGELYTVDGFELKASLSASQSGGQDVPEQALEGGYNARGRNVLNPESGTLTGAVTKRELAPLKRSYHRTELVEIIGPEGVISDCFVEVVDRDHEGGYYDKVDVDVNFHQAFLAEIGSVTVQAVTTDAKHSPKAGSDGDNGGQASLVQSDSKNNPKKSNANKNSTSNASSKGAGPKANASSDGNGGGGWFGAIENAMEGIF